MKKIAYVGIDYHINLLSIVVVIEGEKELYETIRLSNNDMVIIRYMKSCQKISKSRHTMRHQAAVILS